MFRLALAIIGTAGCYAPEFPAGVACVDACPGDQVCIDGTCRPPGYVGEDAAMPDMAVVEPDAPIDGNPDVDTDGDGLFDNVDNCFKIGNLDQHDEDADEIGDVCDPCPHVAIGAATDTDTDGVGDACDPEPGIPKQRWVYFDPFTSRRTEWMNASGATFGIDQLRLTNRIELHVPVTNARIQTAGMATVAAGSAHQMVLQFGHADATHYYYAEFYDEDAGGDLKITRYNAGSYVTVIGTPYPGIIPAGAWAWTVDFSSALQTVGFGATHGAMAFPYQTAAASPAPAPPIAPTTYFYMKVDNVTMTYDYFALIATESPTR